MRPISLRLIVAILTFVIGVTLASLFLLKYQISPSPKPDSLSKPHSFNLIKTDSGIKSMYYYYESSDGVKLMRASIDFSTAKRAGQELEYKLQLNQNNIPPDRVIVEHGAKIDANGQKIGERAVALFGQTEHQLGLVVWTDDGTLNWIESPSLAHVLELEKSQGFR